MTYRDYRIRVRLRSPLGTPMQSDTLFGHLAWQIAREGGSGAVADFLEPFLDGEPPFILSDAFPSDLLPRPLLPVAARPADRGRAAHAEAKRRGKAPFIKARDFPDVAAGVLHSPEPESSPWTVVQTPHASIDRNTWTTTPGGEFFFTEAQTLTGGRDSVDVYLRAADGWADRVHTLLRNMAPAGFGRDKSVGYGAFEVVGIDDWPGFAPLPGADAFISMSTYMPGSAEPVDGRWRIRIKRGYLGETAGQGNPFKRPMVQFEPGAAFRAPGGPAPFYGRMAAGIAPGMPEAVQCGYTLAAPCRWPK